VVNGKAIFPLVNDQPVVIALTDENPAIVVTDGFHITRPLKLNFKEPSYYNFRVECVINDLQLLGGALLLGMVYLLGFATGIFLIKLASFLPIVIFIFIFYMNRHHYIRLRPTRDIRV
jgi:hypothetical protein